MQTANLRALLLEALVFGVATAPGCANSGAGATAVAPAGAPMPASEKLAVGGPPSSGVTAGVQGQYTVPSGITAQCADGFYNVLPTLRPAQSLDYVELRQRSGGEPPTPRLGYGAPCLSASATDACHQALREPVSAGFGVGCRPGQCDFHLLVTDKDGVKRVQTLPELAAFLGPVDTEGEALLVAFANNHPVLSCPPPAVAKLGKDWTMTARLMVEECPIVYADVTLKVTESGAVNVVRTANRQETQTCVGRRPAGLHCAEVTADTGVGTYLAQCAYLEAASVPAFERLEHELFELGAPQHLRRLCARAAADERRHARAMGHLAQLHGASVPEVVIDAPPPRDALALAIENATEGCVRETFGALLGLYQAQCASDPQVRKTMCSIARDEVRHAALAWKIAAWIEPRLSPSDLERVRYARAQAVAQLRAELHAEPATELQSGLGLPNAAQATHMAAKLASTLWVN